MSNTTTNTCFDERTFIKALSTTWQPIATAPSSGRIRLWWRGAGECIGQFTVDEDWTPQSRTPREGFMCEGDQAIPRNQEDCTHWMLLGDPPPGQVWPHFAGRISDQESLRRALVFRARFDMIQGGDRVALAASNNAPEPAHGT